MQCGHLRQATGQLVGPFGSETQFRCGHPRHVSSTTEAGCLKCPDWYRATATNSGMWVDEIPKDPRQPLGVVTDKWGRDAGVGDLYYGASCFLVLGGPSTKTMPLSLLNRRGVLVGSVNNCPAVLPAPLRPHWWLHTDPCKKFCDSLWKDPSILKFTPIREWGLGRGGKRTLRQRNAEGLLELWTGRCARDMPGVLGFHRNTEFRPDEWLFEASINRGNDKEHSEGQKANGWPNVINTMFAAIRLAFFLGIRRLYLVGADFSMTADQPYGFDQGKTEGGAASNNHAYLKMCVMFDALRPKFDAVGFEVLNCTPNSGLWSFEFFPFEEAVENVTRGIEQTLRTDGWYGD